jgi:6,7-dimethyl-8-ribityllumazine synthase
LTYPGSSLRIAIVHARWNWGIIEPLLEGAKKVMITSGVAEENIVVQSVPGSYELPFAVQR